MSNVIPEHGLIKGTWELHLKLVPASAVPRPLDRKGGNYDVEGREEHITDEHKEKDL